MVYQKPIASGAYPAPVPLGTPTELPAFALPSPAASMRMPCHVSNACIGRNGEEDKTLYQTVNPGKHTIFKTGILFKKEPF
jgi:hypothetical protein